MSNFLAVCFGILAFILFCTYTRHRARVVRSRIDMRQLQFTRNTRDQLRNFAASVDMLREFNTVTFIEHREAVRDGVNALDLYPARLRGAYYRELDRLALQARGTSVAKV